MSAGLLALLDDVAMIAKLAATTLDDAIGQAAKAGTKAAGIVIDDTAVTPRYVVGFAAERELPIIWKIAKGSLFNKLVYLLPAAILLSYFAPWAITPILMAGGAFLCFEGFEKAEEWITGVGHAPSPKMMKSMVGKSAAQLEDEKVAGAIRTDLILSAEIMALSLATVSDSPLATQIFALIVVALMVTGGVYGMVALIVKADDAGMALAQSDNGFARRIGDLLVHGMPSFLTFLSVLGTLAMLWVGGGIILHGLAHYGVVGPEHALQAAGAVVGSLLPVLQGFAAWVVAAAGAGIFGLAVGFVVSRALDVAGIEVH